MAAGKKKTRPHRLEERRLWRAGHQHVAGLDEAGKGAWAGPLVAAADILPMHFKPGQVNDSKQLTARQREKLFVHITRSAVSWAVGVIHPAYIDRHGIVAANTKAMLTALKKLHVRPDALLIDALPLKYGKKPVRSIIDGDAKVLTIAAASIVAKVVRDALMDGEHRLYPHYDFTRHKGYGTDAHQRLLAVHGPSPIHRRSFRPIKALRKSR